MNLKQVCIEDEMVLAQSHLQCRALVLGELNLVSVVIRYVCSCIQATVLVSAKYRAVSSEASDPARVMFCAHE